MNGNYEYVPYSKSGYSISKKILTNTKQIQNKYKTNTKQIQNKYKTNTI
ncbi:hypothetical protein JCM30760_14570 [Thiomicrorhabdus hydrogeniphila]